MRFPFVDRLTTWRKRQHVTPLVSPQSDLQLVQRIHGRRMPTMRQLRYMTRVLSPMEQRLFRFSTVFLCVGLLSLAWALLGRFRVHVPAVGGRYVEAIVGSPQRINPVFAPINSADMDIARLIYSGLMRYDEQNRLVPDLATRYELSDDKRTYTMSLKQDVVWHDGKPFTARDVLFTIHTIQNPAVGSPLFVSFQGVKLTMLDEYTVQFELKEPFPPFLSGLTVGMLPEHLWGSVPPEHVNAHKLNISPVGTGPFLVKKFIKDDTGAITQYELKRFDRYYRQPPYLAEFAFRFYPDYQGDNGAIVALRQQEVAGLNFVPYQLRERVERKHILLHTLQLPQYSALFFNTGAPFLESLDVRTALSYTIDKDRILRESLHGDGTVIEGPVLAGFPGYATNTPKTPYDIAQANALLDKIWPRVPADEYRQLRRDALLKAWDEHHPVATTTATSSNTSTLAEAREALRKEEVEKQLNEELREAQTFYRKTKDGAIVSFSLVTADTIEYRQTAKLVAGFWQEVGLLTRITFVTPADMSRIVLRDRSYDILLYGVIVGGDPDQYPFWHSSQADFPGLNLSRYANRTVDGILEKARTGGDDAQIAALYRQFEDAVLKDRPAVFLYTPTYTYTTGDALHGIGVTRISAPADRFAGVTNWYIKTKGEWRWK